MKKENGNLVDSFRGVGGEAGGEEGRRCRGNYGRKRSQHKGGMEVRREGEGDDGREAAFDSLCIVL